ncbi:MAG: hypothetical protein M0R41_05075 [Methylobacter tundripaludum]|uniref:Uncharacterized protein n=1 Tax=Methylobacter tundripaludum TaxID=173365 RepID=A0A2S6GMZ7_9GAMM|nr:hypothetical protein [Methylobacter tundripaludum]MCK9635630.1 hypothetical protein [Methylobacter tundripaludum]PPK66560.1 hypothetical protein B0F88_1168 [Methylobacter tundripaludum]
MDLSDCRRNSRRTSKSRRTADRRIAPYPFGSPEWVEHVKKNYVAWPKSDRRDQNRRCNERRAPDRRHQQLSEQGRSELKFSTILLTQEERQLIENLYLSDFE